ncbi:MAG: SpoIID/LytB domain-containing protein [Clostridium sp.]|nr:SpoIID/LytB domain-containing protein [Acetatifactor muris]MCM1528041.1 SpoIID/LytB domain-containing protein [Bacteroides sp.]MCM1564203.1 SpoIID/LytB domain-containing protein [Clostridium sp.]
MGIRDWGQFHQLNRRERMQLKAWICVLGAALLIFLFVGRLLFWTGNEPEEPEPEPHVPVIVKLTNVWIIEAGEDNLLLYRDGAEESYNYGTESGMLYQPMRGIGEQIADVILTDGRVTGIKAHTEKIHGVILGADEASIEVEGYGRLPLASDYGGYRIYNTLAMCTYKDLAFGYDFADLVLEDGEVCGILMVREETMDSIRVLIKTSDYGALLHEELALTADTDFVIRYGALGQETEELHAAGEEVVIRTDSDYFEGGRVMIQPSVLTGRVLLQNVNRSQGVFGYRGHMELLKTAQGIAVVNELSLEEYLYAVVPGEMPASYSMEALKAQAICARTYAYSHMRHAAYPAYGAHVDDSTSYQVYHNIPEQVNTTQAVKETYGQLLYTAEGQPAGTYYYSTSCGVGSDANVWKTEAAAGIRYLKAEAINETLMQEKLVLREQQLADGEVVSVSTQADLGEYLREEEHFAEFITHTGADDFEAGEGWYRWSYEVEEISPEHMYEVLKKRYQANADLVLTLDGEEYISAEPEKFTKIKEIRIAARGSGGVADELILETDKGDYKVISEHNIRYVLCDGETKVRRQIGDTVQMPSLLPSGFFIIETGKKNGNVIGYTLTGGGFGHGVGMSQNGAKAMALKGYSCEEILLFFYEDCSLRSIY